MNAEIHLECLLGRCVWDENDRSIGHIEEIRVAQQNGEWVITEYHVGRAAFLERFSAWRIGSHLLRVLTHNKTPEVKKIPWDKLDLSDPTHPRLREGGHA